MEALLEKERQKNKELQNENSDLVANNKRGGDLEALLEKERQKNKDLQDENSNLVSNSSSKSPHQTCLPDQRSQRGSCRGTTGWHSIVFDSILSKRMYKESSRGQMRQQL